MKKIKGSLILLLGAAIWGFAFVAQTAASETIEPFTFNGVRCLIGALVLVAYLAMNGKWLIPDDPAERRALLLGGLLCGGALFAAINLQQYAITLYPRDLPVSGRGGFLTATYVVMVPLCDLFFRRRIHPLSWLAVGISLVGMYLLCCSGGFSRIYFADGLMLLGALFFTVQILSVDRFSHCDSIRLSCMQFLVCGVLSLLCMAVFETPKLGALTAAWLPLLYAGVMSNGVAYTFQICGQRTTEPALASIIMSLESVFAALGGWLLLSEHLSPAELTGCVLMFGAVILAQLPTFFKSKKAA